MKILSLLICILISFSSTSVAQTNRDNNTFVEKVKCKICGEARAYDHVSLTKVEGSTNLFFLETRRSNGDKHSVFLKSYEKKICIEKLEELRTDGLISFEGESRKRKRKTIEIGYYKNNLPIDTFRIFNLDNSLIETKKYSYLEDSTALVECHKYHISSHKIAIKSLRKNGELHGRQETYDIDGLLLESVNYDNGKKEGKWITYFKSGEINSIEQYKCGELISSKVYDENGIEFIPKVRVRAPHYEGGVSQLQTILDSKMAPTASTQLRGVDFTFSVDVDGSVRVVDVVPDSRLKVYKSDIDKLKQLVQYMPPMSPCIYNDKKIHAFFTYKHYYRRDIDTAKFKEELCWIDEVTPHRIKNFEYTYKEKTDVSPDMKGVMPRFPGGDRALFNYLKSTVKFPRIAQEKGIKGLVIIDFDVSTTGELVNVRILKGAYPFFEKEALRVVKEMPNWTAGTTDEGEPVVVSYRLPINFNLNN